MIKIPLFPLNMIVLPFEKVPLHIFEDRYKKMISNSIENNSPFGIVSNNRGSVDKIGCTLNVTKVIKHYETGEYDLIATGEKCFQILDKIKKNDLWIGNIEYLKNPVIEHGSLLKSVQNKYLELLIKIGKGKNFDDKFWMALIRQILVMSLIEKDIESYGVIRLTEKGLDFIKKP